MIVLTIVTFVLILGVFILVHEYGHFLIARLFKMKVEEFGFGYPPRLWKKQYKGVVYSINGVPFGGFVKILGMDAPSSEAGSFSHRKIWQRILVIIAGIAMNFLLAIVILSVAYSIGTTPLILDPANLPGQKSSQILIGEVFKDSPAAKAGLQEEDSILGFAKIEDFQNYIRQNRGQSINLQIKHKRQVKNLQIIPSDNPEAPLGISLFSLTEVKMSPGWAIVTASRETIALSGALLKFIGKFFADLFTHGRVPSSVVGPVGIFVLTGEAVKFGLSAVLQLAVLLTLNLVWINLLPFPALDGSRLLFLIFEGLSRRKIVKMEVENLIHTIGFILLILLALAITYRDIMRLVK